MPEIRKYTHEEISAFIEETQTSKSGWSRLLGQVIAQLLAEIKELQEALKKKT